MILLWTIHIVVVHRKVPSANALTVI